MDKALIIGIALILVDRYLRRKDQSQDLPEWFIRSNDYWYVLPVGISDTALELENNVMSYKSIIMKVAQYYGIEAAVIAGIIYKESQGVASKTNGRYLGLMQFGLAEASSMLYKGTAESLLNPETNIYWGTTYLDYCIEKRKSLVGGVSGYNTGNVEGNPLFNASYVGAVTRYANRFRYLLNQEYPGYATIFPKETWLTKPEVV